MNSVKMFLGVLTGVAVGALVGILFAPQKGSRTRNDILHAGEEYAEKLKDNFSGLVNNATKKVENTWHDAQELVMDGKAKYDDAKKDVKKFT